MKSLTYLMSVLFVFLMKSQIVYSVDSSELTLSPPAAPSPAAVPTKAEALQDRKDHVDQLKVESQQLVNDPVQSELIIKKQNAEIQQSIDQIKNDKILLDPVLKDEQKKSPLTADRGDDHSKNDRKGGERKDKDRRDDNHKDNDHRDGNRRDRNDTNYGHDRGHNDHDHDDDNRYNNNYRGYNRDRHDDHWDRNDWHRGNVDGVGIGINVGGVGIGVQTDDINLYDEDENDEHRWDRRTYYNNTPGINVDERRGGAAFHVNTR